MKKNLTTASVSTINTFVVLVLKVSSQIEITKLKSIGPTGHLTK